MTLLSFRAWKVAATGAALVLCGARAHAEQPAPDEQTVPVCTSCGFPKTVARDVRGVFTAPAHWEKPEWRSATIKAAIVAGSMLLLDEPVRDYVQEHRNGTTDRIAKAFEPFGAEYALGVVAGFAIVGSAGNKPTARSVALDGAVSSLIASALVVPALKELTGRSRPNAEHGAFQFDPLGGAESFPSGHTAEAFTVAASIAENYDRPWVKGLSYGVAGLVAYARLEHDAHWLSDATASAFIGIGVAKEVAMLNRARPGIVLTPTRVAHGWGVEIARAF
jgi:membrane-associated phospholipid phosphatase